MVNNSLKVNEKYIKCVFRIIAVSIFSTHHTKGYNEKIINLDMTKTLICIEEIKFLRDFNLIIINVTS